MIEMEKHFIILVFPLTQKIKNFVKDTTLAIFIL